jgi:hypothetical protein
LVHLALQPPIGLLCQPRVVLMMEKLMEEKTCPTTALSTTKPTRYLDANPDRRGGKPATNGLSYDTAHPIHTITNREWAICRRIKYSQMYSNECVHTDRHSSEERVFLRVGACLWLFMSVIMKTLPSTVHQFPSQQYENGYQR